MEKNITKIIIAISLFLLVSFTVVYACEKNAYNRVMQQAAQEAQQQEKNKPIAQIPTQNVTPTPTVSITVTPESTVQVTPTPIIRYVDNTRTVYITVTPTPTPSLTPTPEPTPVVPNTGWIITQNRDTGAFDICRFPGGGASIRMLGLFVSFSDGHASTYNDVVLNKTRDTTFDVWPGILTEGQTSPVLSGSCYAYEPQGEYIFAFQRYGVTTEDVYFFVDFDGSTVTTNVPSSDDYHLGEDGHPVPDLNWTNWIRLNEPG